MEDRMSWRWWYRNPRYRLAMKLRWWAKRLDPAHDARERARDRALDGYKRELSQAWRELDRKAEEIARLRRLDAFLSGRTTP
ncbi:hypothetical protein SAMN02745194_04523 [Roseomonas rosea]|uniref:Uncharacterized protein n=1 Tax=Muricoccus roseus TaxID=198092 RepID=A0A1M6QUD5_9PROT|nr:hypothetical protein [Roseomonas rosea]SHK23892.1 hypothetical protein SAMN02745194_04523 [Roseomonas rosea]